MVTNKPTTIVQIMSQSDIMRNTNGQNYKINRKIWDEIEKQNNNGNENTEPEVPTEADSRDITFTVIGNGQPVIGVNFPVTVDSVTENTDENSQAVFNLVDGIHTAKIIISIDGEPFTYYYNDAIVTNASHTEYSLDILDGRDLSYEFVDVDSKEVIYDVEYFVELFDIVSETISARANRKTGDSEENMIAIPIRCRVYADDSSSEVLDEKSIDRNYEGKITFEVPSPREVSFIVKDIENNPVASASVNIDGGILKTTGSAGGCTALLLDGTHTLEAYKEISRDVYIRYAGSITVDSENTHFDIVLEPTQQEI